MRLKYLFFFDSSSNMLSFDTTSIWGIILMLTLATLFVVIWYSYKEIVFCRKKIEELGEKTDVIRDTAIEQDNISMNALAEFTPVEQHFEEWGLTQPETEMPQLFEAEEAAFHEITEEPEEIYDANEPIEVLEEKPKKKGRKPKKIENEVEA